MQPIFQQRQRNVRSDASEVSACIGDSLTSIFGLSQSSVGYSFRGFILGHYPVVVDDDKFSTALGRGLDRRRGGW